MPSARRIQNVSFMQNKENSSLEDKWSLPNRQRRNLNSMSESFEAELGSDVILIFGDEFYVALTSNSCDVAITYYYLRSSLLNDCTELVTIWNATST